MKAKTKNFDPDIDVKLACTCGHKNCDKRSVKMIALVMLQKVRDELELPMIVTSGGRCPNHNAEMTRTKPADHQKGLGVDIKIDSLSHALKIAAIAVKHGFNAIAINLNSRFIHLGYRPELNGKIVTWDY